MRQCSFRFKHAIDVSDAATLDYVWNLCSLAADLKRTQIIAVNEHYTKIGGIYLMAHSTAFVDATAVPASDGLAGVVDGSASRLRLAQTLGAQPLGRLHTSTQYWRRSTRASLSLSAISRVMANKAVGRPGARVLSPPFMAIRQAMSVSARGAAALAHLCRCLADLARDGTIGAILEGYGVTADCAHDACLIAAGAGRHR